MRTAYTHCILLCLEYFSSIYQDPAKAKQFFPFLQRAGKTVALVEVRLVLHDHIVM